MRRQEQRIRQLKTEEALFRKNGDLKTAAALRKAWRKRQNLYEAYCYENGRAVESYRYVIDKAEIEERALSGDSLVSSALSERSKNSDYLVNREVINSGTFKEKFKSDLIPNTARNTLYKVAKDIVKRHDGTATESYAYITKDGEILKQAVTGEHGGFVDYEILQKQEKSSITLIHNHPGSHGFSLKDINFLLTNPAVGCIIAVGHKGNLFVLQNTGTLDSSKLIEEFLIRRDGGQEEEESLVEILKENGYLYEEK